MLQTIRLYIGDSFDPHYNLAVEQYLLENQPKDSCTLYLWQNQNTVVIGRNQNAWKECRVSALEQDGGKLARRLSGGGAVFHDLGNLNFTFLTSEEHYNVDRQLSVIQEACRGMGIRAEKSGRNDLLAEGRKFSGNAFYQHHGNAYHHGTLLIDTDGEKLQRYLSPPKAKLQSKGVDSVRSRVINLSELSPALTCATMRQAMVTAFETVYGMKAQTVTLTDSDREKIEALRQKNADWQWLFGSRLPLSFECERHFSWGHFQLQLHVESGTVQTAKVYTDALDWQLSAAIEPALAGCRFALQPMQEALRSVCEPQMAEDLCQMLEDQDI